MDKINLFGAGGHGRVIMEIIEAAGDNAGVFYDDNPTVGELNGSRVCKAVDSEIEGPVIVSIGDNEMRKRVVERLNADFATAVHPSAIVSPSSHIDAGSVVMHGSVIQANARIGKHCIINTVSSVDHDCKIGDYVHISPRATLCGNVSIGEGTLIGSGAVVVQGVRIGKWSIIGAGSVVIKDIPDGVIAYGNPCEVHKSRE